jgi:hypothetical protein
MRRLSVQILVLAALLPIGSVDAQKRTGSEEIIVEAPTRSPDKYLRDWHEYRSEHFWVDSDLPSFLVAALVERLEKLRAAELRLVSRSLFLAGFG